MNMLDEGLNIVSDRGIAFGDRFLGYFLMSYGCHITNILNRQNAFFTFQNKIPDLRCQILFTAPPRFSKSLFIKQAIDKQYGLLNANILQTDNGESAMRYAGYCCLPADTMIEMSDGTRKPIETINVNDEVYSLDEHWKLNPSTVTDTFKQLGDIQETILEHGYSIKSTPNHPLRTLNGWVEAKDLKIGDEIAVSMRYPKQDNEYDEDIAAMLGLFTANGSFENMRFYTIDKVVVSEAKRIVQKWGLDVYPTRDRGYDYVIKAKIYNNKNKLKDIFRELMGTRDLGKITRKRKFIPDEIFRSSNKIIATYIRWLFTDGYADDTLICLKQKNRRMLDDVRELLKRFNIVSFIDSSNERLSICSLESKRIFMENIGFVGVHSDQTFRDKKSLGRTGDRISSDFWDIKELDNVKSWNEIRVKSGLSVGSYRRVRNQPTHKTVGVIAEFIDSEPLRDLSRADIMFLRVKDKNVLPQTWVYNISVDTPNFVADGIITHNTEARWTGSTKQEEGETVRDIGIAENFKRGIIGMEEFAAITAAMKQSHSSHMEQSFALSLFDGDVYKDLKGHTLDYHTDVTLFAGNQVMRFNLGGGIFSRFLHIFWIPSMKEVRKIAELIWEGNNLPSDTVRLANYRKELVVQYENLTKVRHMEFAEDVKDYLIMMPHYEQLLYKNLIVGYTVMKDSNIPKNLNIHMDTRIRDYIDRAREWRRQLISDPLGYQIIGSIMDLGGLENYVPIEQVIDTNLVYSTPRALTVKVINNMMNDFRLKFSGEKNAVKIDSRKVNDYIAKKTPDSV